MRTRPAVRALATLLLGPLVVALALVASSVTAVVHAGPAHDDAVAVAVPTVHVTVHVQASAVLPGEPDPPARAVRADDAALPARSVPDLPTNAPLGRAPPAVTA